MVFIICIQTGKYSFRICLSASYNLKSVEVTVSYLPISTMKIYMKKFHGSDNAAAVSRF